MKAWVLDEPCKMHLEESAPTTLNETTNVKVKIEEVLFSSSDYHIYNGDVKKKYPLVMGRYGVGVISEILGGDTPTLRKMDRVVVEPFVPCMMCEECREGLHGNCADMIELGSNTNGLLQNFVDLPRETLHVIPSALSNEQALYVSNVAFGINIVDALGIEKGRHVAVFSDSKIGLILSQIIAHYQAVPILISTKQKLLDKAQDLGIFYGFNPDKCDVQQEVLTITGGRMCKHLVYFSNSDLQMKDLLNVATSNATICVCGFSFGEHDSKISVSKICQKHLKIITVGNGLSNFSSAINLLVTGTVDVDKLEKNFVPFDQLDKNLSEMTPEDLDLHSRIVKID